RGEGQHGPDQRPAARERVDDALGEQRLQQAGRAREQRQHGPEDERAQVRAGVGEEAVHSPILRGVLAGAQEGLSASIRSTWCWGIAACRAYLRVKVPVPCARLRRSMAYRVSSTSGTSAATSVRPLPTEF